MSEYMDMKKSVGECGFKTWPIRMSPDSQQAIDAGIKTETRRANKNWLKAKAGDRLRILNCKGQVSMLEMTRDAYEQPLMAMAWESCYAEGITRVVRQPAGSFWQRPGHPDKFYPNPFIAYFDWWDEINADKPGMLAHDDPSPVVLTFRLVTPEGTGYLATEPAHNAPPPEGKEHLGIGEKRSCNQEQDTQPKGGG